MASRCRCSSMAMRSHEARARQVVGPSATADATRGCWSMTASSPNDLARPEARQLALAGHDAHPAGDDDVEPVADLSLLHDGLPVAELERLGDVGEPVERIRVAALEERHPLEPAALLLPAQRHVRSPCPVDQR